MGAGIDGALVTTGAEKEVVQGAVQPAVDEADWLDAVTGHD